MRRIPVKLLIFFWRMGRRCFLGPVPRPPTDFPPVPRLPSTLGKGWSCGARRGGYFFAAGAILFAKKYLPLILMISKNRGGLVSNALSMCEVKSTLTVLLQSALKFTSMLAKFREKYCARKSRPDFHREAMWQSTSVTKLQSSRIMKINQLVSAV